MKKLNEITVNELLYELSNSNNFDYVKDCVRVTLYANRRDKSRELCTAYLPAHIGDYLIEKTVHGFNLNIGVSRVDESINVDLDIVVNM